ncbi:STAS domain-containing protein [Niallia taxi]|uniref:STAS domain-containing protein n=1 Tax=Niallia taxi TaxID=2499688 RepID=UPI002E1A2A81|nr:STAS domain-containing protein [Niallia taxi]MED4119759.1 STAS domain-containing protein [Niallia taxi]
MDDKMEEHTYKAIVKSKDLTWDYKKGLLNLQGESTLLMWDSAIELFLRTIDEVSGKDASKTVYEATGYRMGHLVCSYYKDRSNLEDIINDYSEIYKTAGWGNFKIIHFSKEENKLVIQITNSWEKRIFKDSNGNHVSTFIPSFWAGIFGGFLGCDMWYEVKNSEATEADYKEIIEIFPSSITPQKNIHDFARQKETQSIQALEEKVNEHTEELSNLVKELSSPIIPILEGILVVPLIGKYSEQRASDLLEDALIEISRQKAKYLLIDVTGIHNIDEFLIYGIQKLIQACRLLGAECFIVGISSNLAMQILNSEYSGSDVQTFATLQQGVRYAIELTGYELVRKKS